MSGAASIPFAFLTLCTEGRAKEIFAVSAYVSLSVFAYRRAWRNYQILASEKPAKREALLQRMVGLVKLTYQDDTKRAASIVSQYAKSLHPLDATMALIKFAHEIQTEDDLDWFCCQFEKHGYRNSLKI